ncbi:MAG TPA: hypothetical protein VFY75_07685 [Solirubrobacterales bacterium]|nr:hypothetical protein [Solirubrobacterales bacterium]
MNLRTLSAVLMATCCAAFLIGPAAASATVVISEGELYTGTIKAEAGTTELHGEAFSVNCKKSTTEGTVESHGESVTAGGKLSSLTFSECSNTVTVLSAGSLEIHATSEGKGTVTSSGAKITIHGPFGINCLYETSNTDVGTLTGGTPAKIDVDSALIPRTGDSVFCGSSGEWTGSYTVATPANLQVAPAKPQLQLSSATDPLKFIEGEEKEITVEDPNGKVDFTLVKVELKDLKGKWELTNAANCLDKTVKGGQGVICKVQVKCVTKGETEFTAPITWEAGKQSSTKRGILKCP